jgi:F-type H+-transporting ATPase subunit beta
MGTNTIIGKISAVRGTVCDIRFDNLSNDNLPEIYHLLEVTDKNYTKNNEKNELRLPPLKMEVLSHLGDNTVRALALGNTFMLGREMEVSYHKEQLRFPVNITGRMFNTLGDTIDGFGESYSITDNVEHIAEIQHYGKENLQDIPEKGKLKIIREEIIQDPPAFKDISESTDLLHTYIKVVDVICPIAKGSKVGFFGGAGTGKTVFIKEMINTLTEKEHCKTIFAGVGERTREGAELWEEFTKLHNQKIEDTKEIQQDEKPGIMHNLSFIFGQMNEPPGIRFRTAHSAVRVAEYFRDQHQNENNTKGNNVMLFIDNIFRFVQAGSEVSTLLGRIPSSVGYQPTLEMEIGDLQERICSTKHGSITSIQAVYVPADDMTDPAPTAIFAHLDSKIVLNRDIAAKSLYPAVDILESGSNLISKIDNQFAKKIIETYFDENNEKLFTKDSIEILLVNQQYISKKVKEILSKDKELEKIINLLGIDQLTDDQRVLHKRAIALKYFFTQPFEVSKKFSGQEGKRVPIWESLFGCLVLCVHKDVANFEEDNLLLLKDIGGIYSSYLEQNDIIKNKLTYQTFASFIDSLPNAMKNSDLLNKWIGEIRG